MSFDDLDSLLTKDMGSKGPVQNLPLVMVVDDDGNIRDALNFVLKSKYKVRLCASGMEAVTAISQETCAVVLDIKMPGMDGFATCKKLKEKFPNVPVIFHSAYQDLKDPQTILKEYNPFGYVTKGQNNSSPQLLDLLKRAVEHFNYQQKTGDLLSKLKQYAH